MQPVDFSILDLFPSALTAISCGFLVVRWTKGSWTKYPHFLAVAIVGATASVSLTGIENTHDVSGYLTKLLTGLFGAFVAIQIFSFFFPATQED